MKTTRILFYYSFLAATFLVISGIASVKSPIDIIYVVFLAPVLAYFILVPTKVIKIKDKKLSPGFFVGLATVMLLLAAMATLKIVAN